MQGSSLPSHGPAEPSLLQPCASQAAMAVAQASGKGQGDAQATGRDKPSGPQLTHAEWAAKKGVKLASAPAAGCVAQPRFHEVPSFACLPQSILIA